MLIASCSLKGLPCAAQNDRREQLLSDIIRSLQDRRVDAIVLLGGYFVQKAGSYLNLNFKERSDQLRTESFAGRVNDAARDLNKLRKGALLIFGVDTDGPKSALGDQLCVAWSAKGPVGVGRKVFPTKWEGENGYMVNVDDFGASERVVEIGGTNVLLCACYDAYGIAGSDDKSKYIRKIHDGGRCIRKGDRDFKNVLDEGLREWRKLVKGCNAAAVAIHQFAQSANGGFSTNYWRKHGIATASAELCGGWVVAGANFEGRVPNEKVDVLASHRVPKIYLDQGNSRRTKDSKPVCDYELNSGDVRVRVFEFE